MCFKPFGIAAHLPFQRVAAGFRKCVNPKQTSEPPQLLFGFLLHPQYYMGYPKSADEITLWSHKDLNLGPTDYESVALTNCAMGPVDIYHKTLFGTFGLNVPV